MTAHIRNLRLNYFKAHCFRSITQIAPNEKLDDTSFLTQFNFPDQTNKYQGLQETSNSRSSKDVIRQLKSANCNQNLIIFYPKSLYLDKVQLPTANDGKENRQSGCVRKENSTPERQLKTCDKYLYDKTILSHRRSELDAVILKNFFSDSVLLNKLDIKPSNPEVPNEKDYPLPRFESIPAHPTPRQTTPLPKTDFHGDNPVEERTSDCDVQRNSCEDLTVKKQYEPTSLNFRPVIDPSDWTLYYCFQGDGGKPPEKERVDRSMFPKGKPDISTLEDTQAALEGLLQFFFKTKESIGLLRSLHYDDVIFVDNYNGIEKTSNGKTLYLSRAVMFQMAMKTKYSDLEVELQSVFTDPDKATVKIHWRIYCMGHFAGLKNLIPFLPSSNIKDSRWMEGVSTFHIGEDGRVFKHVLDGLVPEDKGLALSKSLRSKLAVAVGLKLPKPSIANSKIGKVKLIT